MLVTATNFFFEISEAQNDSLLDFSYTHCLWYIQIY